MPDSLPNKLDILLVTDVFPPGSGGSGWSTYYLGKALAQAGHRVQVLRPRYDLQTPKPSVRHTQYNDLPVEELTIPAVQTWTGKAGLTRAFQERNAAAFLAHHIRRKAVRGEIDVVHGQHKVSAIAASAAVRSARSHGVDVVSVATVRDYWPLCPVSTRLFTLPSGDTFECRDCHKLRPYLTSVRAERKRGKLDIPLAVGRFAATKRAAQSLARCDAVIAVSRYVRDELALSGRVPGNKLYSIPNLVDLPSVDRALAGAWPLPDIAPEQPFLLFVGKWDVNKGASMLPEAVARSGVNLPVVLLGDGPLKDAIALDARSRGLDFRFFSWLDNNAVLRVMKSARALLFPSCWQEPLSRVLLEGCATGSAVVALNTGGTSDVIVDGASGWLASNMDEFAAGISRITNDSDLNARLRQGARGRAEHIFAAPRVAAEVIALYGTLLDGLGAQS